MTFRLFPIVGTNSMGKVFNNIAGTTGKCGGRGLGIEPQSLPHSIYKS